MKEHQHWTAIMLGLLLTAILLASGWAQGKAQKGGYRPAPDPAITYTAALSGLLYVMNDDGSNQTLVHGGTNAMPSWSPDGSQIVFASDSRKGKGIYIINKDGSGTCRLANLNGSMWPYIGPVWSPVALADGKFKVVYADVPVGGTKADLFVVNANCANPGQPVNITNTPTISEWFPSWSRFASQIAAQVDVNGYGTVVVFNVGISNGVVKIISQTRLADLGLFPVNPDPSVVRGMYEPDFGKSDDRLVISSNLSVAFDYPQIWLTDLTASGTYNVTQGKVAFADIPSWSPDGTEIIFRQSETLHGTPIGLFKINLTTGAVTQLTGFFQTDVKGYYPDWRRCFRICPPDKPGCQLCK